MHFAQLFERADRLLTIGGVVVHERYALATDITAIEIEDMVDRVGRTIPVVDRIIENPLKHFAVGSRGPAITHGVDRDTVSGCFGDQLVGDTCGERLIDKRALSFGRLIALHTFFGVVAGFAFDHADRLAADTAITLVQECEVVGKSIRKRDAVGRIRTGPIAQAREYQVRHRRQCHAQRSSSKGRSFQQFFHQSSSSV